MTHQDHLAPVGQGRKETPALRVDAHVGPTTCSGSHRGQRDDQTGSAQLVLDTGPRASVKAEARDEDDQSPTPVRRYAAALRSS